jgi:hypothetical protein
MEQSLLKKHPGLTMFLVFTAIYTLVYFFERALARLVHVERIEPSMPPYVKVDLVAAIYPFLIILLIAALAWFILSYLPPNRMGPIFLILSGLFIIVMRYYHYFGYLFGDLFFPVWLSSKTALGRFRVSFMSFGMFAYQAAIYYLGSGSILIGIAALLRYRKVNRNSG